MTTDRRDFLKATALVTGGAASGLSWFSGSVFGKSGSDKAQAATPQADFSGVKDFPEDDVRVAEGFAWDRLVSRGDVINAQGETFGDCCDFTQFLPGEAKDQAFLWVNNEYVVPSLLWGKQVTAKDKTNEMIEEEMKLVGGSLVELRRKKGGSWTLNSSSKRAFRLDANTEIPLVGPAGGKTVTGTMGNCSGGKTPWGTVLTCEENTDGYFDGETPWYGWWKLEKRPLEDYGWVVEVDPNSSKARKLTALGRFAHEGATVTVSADDRVVVYMGDDARFQSLYKFVSDGKVSGDPDKDRDLLVEGTLYAADLAGARWVPLTPDNKELIKEGGDKFKKLANILTHTREAARAVGATPLNRPEGIAIDPEDGTVFVALTNNDEAGDFYGSVLALREENQDPTATRFSFGTHVVGGAHLGFACPDNLAIGPRRSLWIATDVGGYAMGKGAYADFRRNALVRLDGKPGGGLEAKKLLTAPRDAEVTGPCFEPDADTLFLSIQHPGETSYWEKGRGLTSHWPAGGESTPKSSVITVVGKKASFA